MALDLASFGWVGAAAVFLVVLFSCISGGFPPVVSVAAVAVLVAFALALAFAFVLVFSLYGHLDAPDSVVPSAAAVVLAHICR